MNSLAVTSTEQVMKKMLLLKVIGMSCGWVKGSARYRETWWWIDDVSNSVCDKWKLRKEWRQKNKSKKKYLEGIIGLWQIQ